MARGGVAFIIIEQGLVRVQLLFSIIGNIKVFLKSLLSNIMWASWRKIIGFTVHNSTFDIYGKLMNKTWKSVIVVVGQLGFFRRKAGACFYSNGMWGIIRKCSPPIFSRQFQNYFLLSLKEIFQTFLQLDSHQFSEQSNPIFNISYDQTPNNSLHN